MKINCLAPRSLSWRHMTKRKLKLCGGHIRRIFRMIYDQGGASSYAASSRRCQPNSKTGKVMDRCANEPDSCGAERDKRFATLKTSEEWGLSTWMDQLAIITYSLVCVNAANLLRAIDWPGACASVVWRPKSSRNQIIRVVERWFTLDLTSLCWTLFNIEQYNRLLNHDQFPSYVDNITKCKLRIKRAIQAMSLWTLDCLILQCHYLAGCFQLKETT